MAFGAFAGAVNEGEPKASRTIVRGPFGLVGATRHTAPIVRQRERRRVQPRACLQQPQQPVGWTQSNGGARVGGAYANFLNYSPWVSVDGGSVSTWTMLIAGNEFSQVGWVEYPYSARYDFYEVYDNAHGNVEVNLTPEPINHTTNYDVMFENQGVGTTTVRITGTSQCNTPYCQWTFPIDFIPVNAMQNGEVHIDDDQVPGHYTLPEDISGAQVWFSSWIDFNGAPFRAQSWMNLAKYSSTHLQFGDASSACHV
jgi:hypothetical protein